MAEDAQQFTANTIMLVEDDEDTREFLAMAIATETTYHILSMESGLEILQGLDEVLARRPVLLMLDYQLPAMTGLDLYYRLHTTKELENVPTIIITADPLNIETRRTFNELNIAVLEKPFDLNELISFIEQAMRPEALTVIDSQ